MCKKKYVHYKFNKINKIKLLAQIELALESYRTGSCLKRHTHKTKSCKSLERVNHASLSLEHGIHYKFTILSLSPTTMPMRILV